MKRSVVDAHHMLKDVDGWKLVCQVHDEAQSECYEKDAVHVGQTFVDAIRGAGERYNLRIAMDGDMKIGKNWGETH